MKQASGHIFIIIVAFLSTLLSLCSACTSGSVRLVGGNSNLKGRVEVCKNGAWGTVCDDYWGKEEAQVVCKQLGFISGVAVGYAYFGQGTGSIVMDDVHCHGNESSITACTHTTDHNCYHSEDAGVICNLCSNGALQLVNGNSMFEGRVEMCYNNTWGSVCDDSWTNANARVVCRQLGFSTTGAYFHGNAYFGQGQGPIVLDNVICSGTEGSLYIQCTHAFPGLHNCAHSEDVGVVCPSSYNCTYGSLRLVGGSYIGHGRVEVCVNNQWGTVCDNGWTNLNAQVVCEQLGHGNLSGYEGAVYLSNAYYGRGSGSIFLDNVQCTGTENKLIQCSHNSIGSSSCSHSDDVGVICFTEIRSRGTIVLSRNNLASSSYSYGVVRVWYNGWGNICDDSSFGYSEANVICHQLGYTGVSTYTRAGLTGYGSDYYSMVWDDVDCASSNYLSISQCRYTTSIECINSNYYDAAVACYTTRIWDSPFPGMVRLQGGDFSNQGRVEVYCNGQWGTICNAGFDSNDATTLCKQLGYDGYYTYNHISTTGHYNQPIWSSNMVSSATDGCFTASNSCPSTSVSSCTHDRDVTIQCREISYYIRLSVSRTTCYNASISSSVTTIASSSRSSTSTESMSSTTSPIPRSTSSITKYTSSIPKYTGSISRSTSSSTAISSSSSRATPITTNAGSIGTVAGASIGAIIVLILIVVALVAVAVCAFALRSKHKKDKNEGDEAVFMSNLPRHYPQDNPQDNLQHIPQHNPQQQHAFYYQQQQAGGIYPTLPPQQDIGQAWPQQQWQQFQ